MKRLALATLLLAALGMVVHAQQAQAQVSVSVSIGGFYDQLSPYGEWVDCSYGDCWVPRGVAAGWQPYSNGQWIYTRYGWTWVSDDPWGADPYHYGTWAFVGRYGWAWVPGTVWAPAWVTWSYSDSYVGWAPMPPSVTFGSSGYSGRPVVVNQAQYVFVPTNRFVGTNVTSVRVQPQRNAEIFRQAKPVTQFGISGGVVTNSALPMATVQRAMGHTIETREINTANTAPRTVSTGGQVAIVAPARDVKAARASRHDNGQAVQTREQDAVTQAPAPEASREPAVRTERRAEPQRQTQQEPQRQTQQEPQRPQAQRQQPQQQEPQQQQPHQQQPQQREEQQPPAEARAHQDQAPAAHPSRPQQSHEKGKPAGEGHGRDKQDKDQKKSQPSEEEKHK